MRARGPVIGVAAAVGAAALAFVLVPPLVRDQAEPPPSLWKVVSGVGLLRTVDCRGEPVPVRTGGPQGEETGFAGATGFLVGTRVVMGVEHSLPVRGDGCGLRFRVDGRWYDVVEAKAWGEPGDPDRRGFDLATLTLAEDATGHIFEFASEPVRVGETVTVLGYPKGGPLRISTGLVTRKVARYGDRVELAVKVVPDVEGGNSGGPFLNDRGEVVTITSGPIVWANLSSDGRHRHGGIDMPLWWGEQLQADLCRAHPDGGIPGCDGSAVEDDAKMEAVEIPLRWRGS